MLKRWFLKVLISCAVLAFIGSAIGLNSLALGYVSPGKPSGFVNDFAGIVDDGIESQLEAAFTDFEKAESNEISVVTVQSLDGDSIERFAVELFEEWKIGKADKDNGVLLLVAPNEKEVRIEVGYGLEGTLTDAESGSIIDSILVPSFQAGAYGQGIYDASLAIMESTKGEYTVPNGAYNYGTSANGSGAVDVANPDLGWILYAVFIFIFMFGQFSWRFFASASQSHRIWPGGIFGAFIVAFFFLMLYPVLYLMPFAMAGGALIGVGIDYILSRSAKFEAFRSKMSKKIEEHGGIFWLGGGRGGDGGGFGGGGFGGFGGGSSGGGGASGRW